MKELVYSRVFLPALERDADKVAFFDGAYQNTMAGHGDRVLRLADAMRHELGLGPDDRFAVMALNSHEFLELYHAAFLGAGIITPLNLRLAGAELQHIVRDSGARAVFVDAMFAAHLADAQERRVVQLEEPVRVERHDRETIAGPKTQLVAHGVGQAEHPVAVAGHGVPVGAVEEGHLVGVMFERRQEDP
jgi:acyl-CoA synthetase (AMP-forming)/AMP-acid ligase II